ncbi:uncharacterized protein LOC128989077 [Macrosteles quadrilineatus]|uniref:uncharacterized protein LOC128989077 n=1 Tax=Macrosteles quadrilineatus TaxID=74068 RepID=UPI0023E16401|nr:uncharacterized protein LOC128989077 [Macrosteles quadrilineatus]
MSLSISQPATTVLLGTALIKITANNGISHVFRCLLDSGSQLNFMTERAAQLLNVSRLRSTHTIVGISASQSSTKGHALLELSTLGSEVIASNQPFHILDRISAPLPRTQLSFGVYKLVKPFVLADPTFHIPQNIDILIGGTLFPELLTHQSYPLGSNLPFVIGTRLGFVLMGNAPTLSNSSPTSCHSSLLSTTDELHNTLLRFGNKKRYRSAILSLKMIASPSCNDNRKLLQTCSDTRLVSTNLLESNQYRDSIDYRVSSVEFRVSSDEYRVSSFECRVTSIECRVSSVECRVSSALDR